MHCFRSMPQGTYMAVPTLQVLLESNRVAYLGHSLEVGFDADVQQEGCLDSCHLHCVASSTCFGSCFGLPLQQCVKPMPHGCQVSLHQHRMSS